LKGKERIEIILLQLATTSLAALLEGNVQMNKFG